MIANNNNKPCSNCRFCEKITIGHGEGMRLCFYKGWTGYSFEVILVDKLLECPQSGRAIDCNEVE